jgi:hypothetical protein
MWYKVEYCSSIKKNKFMAFEGKWMELENIMLIKVRAVQKNKWCVFSLISRM